MATSWTTRTKPAYSNSQWDNPDNQWDESDVPWDSSVWSDRAGLITFFASNYYPFLDTYPFMSGSFVSTGRTESTSWNNRVQP